MEAMEITTRTHHDVTLVAVVGSLDSNTSPQAQQALDAILSGGARKIVVDLTALDYISSAGLRVLLGTVKRLGGTGGGGGRGAAPLWLERDGPGGVRHFRVLDHPRRVRHGGRRAQGVLVMMIDGMERLAAALSDRYRIERELGAGGMATVYLAATSSTTARSRSRS